MTPKKISKPIELNEEQQAVVSTRRGYWQCLAGPGAGKSQVLVQRFSELIKEGVSPNDILCLGFTATSAKNLRDRVEQQVGKLVISSSGSGAMTFHSWALSLAQENRDEYPFELAEFPLAPEPVANKMSGESARKHDINPRDLRSVASLLRRKRVCPSTAVRDAESHMDPKQLKLALAYKDYCKRQESAGLLDFDSLIYHAVQLMEKKPTIREKYVRQFVMVDESQDLSKIEWDLVKLISGTSVLAVGDLSQNLYSFRGSDSRLFRDMGEIFPRTQTLFLGRNYRSSPEIVEYIRPLAVSKDLATRFHTTNESGPAPEVKGFLNRLDEALWVAKRIKETYERR